MKIIEQKIMGKTGDFTHCEDNIVVTDDFACVIDGATSKSNRLFDGKTTGKFASLIIKEAITKLPRNATLNDTIDFLTNLLYKEYLARKIEKTLKNNPVERPSASVAIYSNFHNQIWLIGDCQCIIKNIVYSNEKEIDKITSEARSLFLELEILSGKSINDLIINDLGRKYILPLLKNQSFLQNNHSGTGYSFGVIDGFTVNKNDVKKIDVVGNEIVLASDGYPKLFDSLYESEAYLTKIIQEDPLLFRKHKSTKGVKKGNVSYDDRAYLKIKLS